VNPDFKGHWIHGREQPSLAGESFDVFDPGNGELVGKAARGRDADVTAAIASSRAALRSREWANVDALVRGRWLAKLGQLLERDKDRLATRKW